MEPPPGTVLLFLESVHCCTHLVPSVLRWASPTALECLDAIFSGDVCCLGQAQRVQNVEVTNDMAMLAQLILPGCDATGSPTSAEASSPCGAAVLDWLRARLFPSLPASQDLMHAICYSTVLQAHQAREICLAALLLSVDTSNCLSVLEFACGCGQEELAARARDAALAAFPAACQADPKAFMRLTAPTLEALLQHDNLQCPEDEVLLSLVSWATLSGEPSRPALLGGLVRACVRSSLLSLKQLEALDQHPLVLDSMEATAIVAGLYLSLVLGREVLGTGACSQAGPRGAGR